jgi:hypothetical protein
MNETGWADGTRDRLGMKELADQLNQLNVAIHQLGSPRTQSSQVRNNGISTEKKHHEPLTPQYALNSTDTGSELQQLQHGHEIAPDEGYTTQIIIPEGTAQIVASVYELAPFLKLPYANVIQHIC